MKVCVLGLGEVGLPTAKYMLGKKLDVWGYDIESAAVKRAKKNGVGKVTYVWDEIPLMDIYVICVPTRLKSNNPDLSPVFEVCGKINGKIASSHPLVSIESTVIPGVSRRVYKDLFKKRVHLVHVPHRYWAEQPVEHGVKQLRVIGGVDSESLERGVAFYRGVLGIPLYTVSTIEAAEISKIAENACRYVQIAFSEELRMVCEDLKLDFDEVRNACNTKWNIKILEARDGIGRHCLPKDVQYLASLATSKMLINGAIIVDGKYREWLASRKKD
jgi:nucleotide sugar dehydrogenase